MALSESQSARSSVALDDDSVNSGHGVPAAEHPCLLQLGRLAIKAAHELARYAVVPPGSMVRFEDAEGGW